MQWELFMGRHPKFHSSHENIRFTQLQRVHPMRKKLLVYIWALYCRSMHALNFDNQHILVNTLRKYKCIGDFSLGEPLISNLTAPLPTQSQKKYLLVLFCISMSPVPQVNACTELWWSAHPGKHSGEAQLHWGGEWSPTIVHHICHTGVLSNQIWGSDISCLCPLNLHWSCSGQ